jgi:hypothetical protein
VAWVAEAVYLSRVRSRVRRAVKVQDLANADLILPEVRWGDMDPTRRQLLALAQNAGVTLRPVVEVESPAVALELAQRGIGDTLISLPLVHVLGATSTLHWASLETPLLETFAFVTRRGVRPSPATAVLIRLARQLLAALPSTVQ